MGHSSERRICAAASTTAPSRPTRSRILVHSRLRTPSSSGSSKEYQTRAMRSVARVPLPAFPMSTTATTAPSRTRTLLGVARSARTMSGASRGGGTSAHKSRMRSTKAETAEELSYVEHMGVGRLTQRPERGAHLFGEELRLLPRGEVTALVHLVEVDVDTRVCPLDPAPRCPPDLSGERGEADRNRDWLGCLTCRSGVLLAFLPVRARR